jgi:hypothetical protein
LSEAHLGDGDCTIGHILAKLKAEEIPKDDQEMRPEAFVLQYGRVV